MTEVAPIKCISWNVAAPDTRQTFGLKAEKDRIEVFERSEGDERRKRYERKR